jgi:outer membrane protein assembly factor BamB
VAAGVPLIDLDVASPRVERAPLSLRRRLTPPRPALVVAVVLAALVALGAAEPPGRSIRRLLSAGGQPAAAFELSQDALFTASFGNSPNSESGVRRFDLPDGRLRWAVALPQNVQNLVYDDASHVLMGRSGAEPKVSFLDADTGEVLWHDESPNTIVVSLAGGEVLMQTDVSADERALRLLDARTGRQVWSRVVDSTAYLGPSDLRDRAPTRLIAVDTAGKVVVLNYADGAVLARGDLHVTVPVQLDNSFGADYVGVSTVGDTLYLSRRERGVTTLAAWSIGSLTRLWQVTGGPAGFLDDCGSVLCVADNGVLSALDPADGRMLWQQTGLGMAYRHDARSLLAFDLSETPEAALLDPATGAVMRRFGRVVDLRDVLLRSDRTRLGRTWVEAAGGDGALHVVGALDTAAPYGCELSGPYLACPTSAGPTQVWQIPLHVT